MLKGKKILQLGLGLQGGGVATARWLVKQGGLLTVTDLKNKTQLANSLKNLKGYKTKYILGKHPGSVKGFDIVVQNPAVPNSSDLIQEAIRKNIPIENEASLFFKSCPASIIGVTGSKGKSTTTALLGHIFKAYKKATVVAGNIRDHVMLDVLAKIKKNTPVILELSSWQLEGLNRWRLSPHLAVITNVLPDHLDRYSSMTQYAEAKFGIFKWQKKDDKAVLNFDNAITKKFANKIEAKIYWFSTAQEVACGCFIKNNAIYFKDNKVIKVMPLWQIKLPGAHNLGNVLAAVTAALASGLSVKTVSGAVASFTGLHSRMQLIAQIAGIKYYNDTTATTPEATIAALDIFNDKKTILIAGGKNKNLKYSNLAKVIKKSVKQLILLPGSATDLLLKNNLKGVKHFRAKDMKQAVKSARTAAVSGDRVILSPGAASFGLFVNEWDRGGQFIKFVINK